MSGKAMRTPVQHFICGLEKNSQNRFEKEKQNTAIIYLD